MEQKTGERCKTEIKTTGTLGRGNAIENSTSKIVAIIAKYCDEDITEKAFSRMHDEIENEMRSIYKGDNIVTGKQIGRAHV